MTLNFKQLLRISKSLILALTLTGFGFAFGQAPNISYPTPQKYKVNIPIITLSPINTGGTVPNNIYGTVTTLAGAVHKEGNIDGMGKDARFKTPIGLVVDKNRNIIYIADQSNASIRKITLDGTVSTIAGGKGSNIIIDGPGAVATFRNPYYLAIDKDGNVYISDNDAFLIRKMTPDGFVSTFAGTGVQGLHDGPRNEATFSEPTGLAVDNAGNLYVSEQAAHIIRKISTSGIVSTFAGTAYLSGSNDGFGMAARFHSPAGLSVDGNGNIIVADQENYMIRQITPLGNVTTIAGNATSGSKDGIGIKASFFNPISVTVGKNGEIYVCDVSNNLIRKISAGNVVTTVAGSRFGWRDGIGRLARFWAPTGLDLDANGNLYIADDNNTVIRKIAFTGYTIDKALPAGLVFDGTTGTISGTPTATAVAANYTITAYNANGSNSTIVNIQVVDDSATPPAITANPASGTIIACQGTASASPNIQQFTVNGNGLTHNIIAIAPANFEVSLTAGSGYGNNAVIPQSGGVANNTVVYVRSAASAVAGSISGKVLVSSSGAVNQEVQVNGIINALPTVNKVSNQTYTNGNVTSPITFTGTNSSFIWANDTPGIGLPASGAGDIDSFTAINTGNSPITAKITVTPIAGGNAYIANYGSNNVSVVSTVTKTLITTIPVGLNPFGVSASPDGNWVYITNKGSNNVSIINTSTNTVTATIDVGIGPQGIAVSPDGNWVYVANSGSNTVSVIDALSNTIYSAIPVGNEPFGIAVSPDGSKVYVTNHSSNTVSVLDPLSSIVIAVIPVGSAPGGIAISPDGGRAYVCNSDSNLLTVINTAKNDIITDVFVDWGPFGVTTSPDGALIYVAVPGGGFLTTIFASNYLIQRAAQGDPQGISITPDGLSLYITDGRNNALNINNIGRYSGTQVLVGTNPISLGNFISKGPGCTGVPITFTITINPKNTATPAIISGPVSGNISACVGTASASPDIQKFTVSGTGLSAGITATAPANFQVSLTAGSGYGNSITIPQSGGVANNTVVYVRPAASAAAGSISGKVLVSSSGAVNQEVQVNGIINALPTVNQQGNLSYNNGDATTPVNFDGSANTFTWINDNPGIGLPASGTGAIPSFTAVNNGSSPVTAKIRVMPTLVSYAYISNNSSSTISVINTGNDKVASTINIPFPGGTAFSPDYKTLYVTNTANYSVSVINVSDNSLKATITVGTGPNEAAVSPDGKVLYVTNTNSNTLTVINTATYAVITTITVGRQPYTIAVKPDGRMAYVANYDTNDVTIINTLTNTMVGVIAVGISPVATCLSPDGSILYVANTGSNNISAINTATNKITSTIPTGTAPFGMTISHDGSTLYVANRDDQSVSVIDVATMQLSTIRVGLSPQGVALSPDGNKLYVSNTVSNNVTVINTATNAVITTVDVGEFPVLSTDGITPGNNCSGNEMDFTITINPKTASTPTIAAGPVSGTISACAGTASASPGIQQFEASGTNLSQSLTATAPAGFEISLSAGSGYSTALTIPQSGGKADAIIYVRSAASAQTGNISGNVILASAGVSSQNVAVNGIINALPTVNPVSGLIYTNSDVTQPITFTGTATTFTWINDNAAIGLSANGTGNIAPFTAINTGSTPLTANITVVPSSVSGCSGIPTTFSIVVNPSLPTAIYATGNLTALTTVYGTPSASGSFTVSGVSLKAGVLVSPPPGFEVSADNITFSTAITIGKAGNLAATPVYIRLAATSPAGNYAGGIVLSTPGITDVNEPVPNSTVTPAPLTITADDISRDYLTANPPLTVTYAGFVNNENESVLTVLPTVATIAVVSSPVGYYPITVSGAGADNYTITENRGTLTVNELQHAIVAPNAFTPNGDGINDTWNIKYLDTYQSCTVKIYTRYGQNIFSSIGYGIAWDGKYKGSELQTGTYYYIIDLKNGTPVIAGYVALIK